MRGRHAVTTVEKQLISKSYVTGSLLHFRLNQYDTNYELL